MFVRFWLRGPVGLVTLGFYLEAAQQTAIASSSGAAIFWALMALAGLFANAFLWHRWWVAAVSTAIVDAALWLMVGPLHPFYAVTVLFSALVAWWAQSRSRWPMAPRQALYSIGVLVMVSLSLSALVALRGVPVDTESVGALVVLYLATPPWEWLVVILTLERAGHLAGFVRDNYGIDRRTLKHMAAGLATGAAMVAVAAAVVTVESRGFHISVRANNPFVYAPRLTSGQTEAAGLVALGVIVLAPLAEEALFRGILFGSLSQRWGYWPGSLFAAVVFGLAHMDLSLAIPLALLGLVFNALYHRTGSLWPSTIAHATFNAVSVLSALGAAGGWRW